MCPIFVIFSGVSDLQGVKIPVFPLTFAGHRYNSAAYDNYRILCPIKIDENGGFRRKLVYRYLSLLLSLALALVLKDWTLQKLEDTSRGSGLKIQFGIFFKVFGSVFNSFSIFITYP